MPPKPPPPKSLEKYPQRTYLRDYSLLEYLALPKRQQYQPATCGVWTIANAAKLAYGQRPAAPANLEESNRDLEKWLRFAANQTAVT